MYALKYWSTNTFIIQYKSAFPFPRIVFASPFRCLSLFTSLIFPRGNVHVVPELGDDPTVRCT